MTIDRFESFRNNPHKFYEFVDPSVPKTFDVAHESYISGTCHTCTPADRVCACSRRGALGCVAMMVQSVWMRLLCTIYAPENSKCHTESGFKTVYKNTSKIWIWADLSINLYILLIYNQFIHNGLGMCWYPDTCPDTWMRIPVFWCWNIAIKCACDVLLWLTLLTHKYCLAIV